MADLNVGNLQVVKDAEQFQKIKFEKLQEAFNKGETLTPEVTERIKKETDEEIKKLKKESVQLEQKKKSPENKIFTKISLEDYKKKLHEWFYFKDDEIIDIQLAALTGEKLPGDPLWLFVIAPPGALKTETLRSFTLNNDFYPLSDLTSRTFVSGLMLGTGENRRKIDDLLPQLNKKVLIFKDFTTVLEKSQEERQQIFAQLREIYDGSFAKKFGTIDQTIRYETRFGFIAGVTPIIDKHWKVMQQLGERFLKVRWEEDISLTTTRSRENEGHEQEMREDISNSAMGFITNIDFSKYPDFDDQKFGSILDKYAEFVAIARTPISIQDYRTDFYCDYIPTPERPTRLVKQLKKLCRHLALIRGKSTVDDLEIKTARRVCLDTIPQDRLKILQTIGRLENTNFNGCPRSSIVNALKLPESSTIKVLEQLKMLDLIKVSVLIEHNFYDAQIQVYYYKLGNLALEVLNGNFK